MRGIAIVVNDADAAAKALATLGMPEAPSVAAGLATGAGLASGKGIGAVMAGTQFLAVVSRERADVASTHRVYLAGEPGTTAPVTAADVVFDRWARPLPQPVSVKSSSIEAIDHIVDLVGSIEAAASELRRVGLTKLGRSWDFPAIGARARLCQLGETWLELNEPLKAGQPTVWGTGTGIAAVVLRTRDIERLSSEQRGVRLSRRFPVEAHPSESEAMVTLGSVAQLKHEAFGNFPVYIYQPFDRGAGPDPKDTD